MTKTNTNTNTTKKTTTTATAPKTATKKSTATATAVPTVEDYKKQVAMAELANQVIDLNERKKQLETLLADAKAKLGDMLPQGETFVVERTGDATKKVRVGWGELTRNTAKPELIVKNHGITLTDADFQTTNSTFIEVKVLKA